MVEGRVTPTFWMLLEVAAEASRAVDNFDPGGSRTGVDADPAAVAERRAELRRLAAEQDEAAGDLVRHVVANQAALLAAFGLGVRA